MKLTGISVKREKHADYEALTCCQLQVGKGITEDYHTGGDKKELCLFDYNVQKEIEEMESRGLWIRRLKANLTVSGLSDSKRKVGDSLVVGDAKIEITAKKRCFGDCSIVREKALCPMKKGVLFARVVEDGKVNVGDEVL